MAAKRESPDRGTARDGREQAVRFGPEQNLVGILSLPAEPTPDRAAIVVLNAGVLHRVGPHRLHVHLTRRLAAVGFTCLRLDLAGIGDSVAVSGALTFRQSAVADTRVAMTELTATQRAERFVLFGLCSGADNALATAAEDPRVAGLVLVDPPTYATHRSRARKLARRVEELGLRGALRWGAELARRELRTRIEALSHAADAADAPSEGRETPPLDRYRQQLHTILDRGAKILAIYSGAMGDRYNHEDQVFEVFPELRGRLDRAYFPDANHMFSERAAQARLVDVVTAWVARQFATSTRPSGP